MELIGVALLGVATAGEVHVLELRFDPSVRQVRDSATLTRLPSGREITQHTVSRRVVERGGTYGRDPVRWRETSEEVGRSERVAWSVDCAPDGTVTVSDLAGDVDGIEAFLLGFIHRTAAGELAIWADRRAEVGDSWRVDPPVWLLDGPPPTIEWTLERVEAGIAFVTGAARQEGVRLDYSAELDLVRGFVRYSTVDARLEVEIGGEPGWYVTHGRTVVTLEPTTAR